ncbi:MAG: glycosyltransferase family 4 protein, partial [Anaerolineales bacterium]
PWMEQIREEAARFDIVHNSRMGREPFSFASYAAARSVGMPFLLTPNHHFRWRGFWYRHYQELYRLADGIIALTQAEKRSLEQMGVDGRRITVTGIGPILAERAEPDAFRREAGIGERFVLFVGQKFRYKNLRSLLDAARLVWSRYPNVRFVFLGPRTEYSQRLFRAVKDARILEKDTVSLQVKANAMAACEVLCLPSLQESFGGVFVEAWMMGKPVVGCDIPAVREVITSGVDGIVAKPTADSLAEAIVHLLDHPDQAREMGERGREKALRRFTWEALARKTEEAYGRALHR